MELSRIRRRHLTGYLSASVLGGMVGSHSSAAALREDQSDGVERRREASAKKLIAAFLKLLDEVRATHLIEIATAYGLSLSESVADTHLRAIKFRLNSEWFQPRVISYAQHPVGNFPNPSTDAGPWIMAILGAAVGLALPGDLQSRAVRARLGATLLNDAATTFSIPLPTREAIAGFDGWPGQLKAHSAAIGSRLSPLWSHLVAAGGLPSFGERRLPNASVVIEPRRTGNVTAFTVRRMHSSNIGLNMIWNTDAAPGVVAGEDIIRAAMYAAVLLSDNTIQIRAHPVSTMAFREKFGLTHQAGIFAGLCRDANCRVLASGYLFVDHAQKIRGLTADLNELYCDFDAKSVNAIGVASGMLVSMGYDLDTTSINPINDLIL